MPPPAPGDVYPAYYRATFVVPPTAGTTYGFDIQPQGYGENTEADVTIQKVPWADPTTGDTWVSVQGGGIQPKEWTYQATFWSHDDYSMMVAQTGMTGLLTTPRQTTGYNAKLMSVRLGRQDRSDVNGPHSATLTFRIIS